MSLSILTGLKKIISGVGVPLSGVDMKQVSAEQLQKSYRAGKELEALQESLAAEGRTPVDVALNGNPFTDGEMYPWQGGILDQRTSCQYFYHSHQEYKSEHGHFHTFYYSKRKLAHLVAIGMSRKGRINKLYTFNRWSPGDTYFPAQTLKSFLPRFGIRNVKDLDPRLHAFINNSMVLFQPEVERLFDERDETFRRYRERNNGQSPYEDRSLEITSSVVVDVKVQMARLRAELESRGEFSAAPAGAAAESPAESPKYVGEIQPPALEALSAAQLKRSHEAGIALRAGMEKLKAAGSSLVESVLNGRELEDWEMYPWDSGVHDKKTRSQYFYHHHPQTPDHGHFHAFFHHGKQLAHLLAVSMDNQGEPLDLFTVNRWVTGDINLPPDKLKAYLPRFRIESQGKFQDVHDFLRNLFALYQPEIGMLLEQREQVYKNYRLAHNGEQPHEDRALEVTSSFPIDLAAHMHRLEGELKRRGAHREAPRKDEGGDSGKT